jgi:circadian clock protein KaiB
MKSESKRRKDKMPPPKIWDLKLYVIDRTLKSVAAFANLTRICCEELDDKCRIEVIDIEKHPRIARERQIVAVPTLVKIFPFPERRVIGDLSMSSRVLAGLGLRPIVKEAK